VIDDEFLVRLKREVPHEQFSLSHNIIAGVHTLAVWYVDTEINTQVTADNLFEELDQVIERATELAVSLFQVDPCIGNTFDVFNPVVVDENYNGWFAGLLASEEITSSVVEISALQDLYAEPYLIQSPPQAIGVPPAGTCNWEESEEQIWFHFSRERQNVSFYFVNDLNGYNVWAQWDGPASMPFVIVNILNITMELECLYPKPDNLILITVGETGELQFLGVIVSNDGKLNIEDLQVYVGG
jgi:hypothetical protein